MKIANDVRIVCLYSPVVSYKERHFPYRPILAYQIDKPLAITKGDEKIHLAIGTYIATYKSGARHAYDEATFLARYIELEGIGQDGL